MSGDSRFYCSFFMAEVALIQFGSLESYGSRLIYQWPYACNLQLIGSLFAHDI